MTNRKDEGFTLIELLIVIVILGILATVVVFAVGGIRDSADSSVCLTRVSEIETAGEAYKAQVANPPADPTIDQLVTAGLLTSATIQIHSTFATTGATTVSAVSAEEANC